MVWFTLGAICGGAVGLCIAGLVYRRQRRIVDALAARLRSALLEAEAYGEIIDGQQRSSDRVDGGEGLVGAGR